MKHFFKFHFLSAGLFAIAILLNTTVFAQKMTYTNLRDGSGISVNLSIGNVSFESLSYKGEDLKEIVLSGMFIPNDEGMPNLPRFSRYIAVPQGAEVRATLKSFETEVITGINLAPALRIQAEEETPTHDYIKNKKVYSTNAQYPSTPFETSEMLSVRGVDAVILGITPFQYNPVTQELTVYKNINIDIEYVGGNNHYGEDRLRSQWFDPILKNVFMNYEELPEIDYASRTLNTREEGCEYLIVVPNDPAWLPYAEQIRSYRIQQGINTKIMSLADMNCTSTSQMKSFFHNAYNTWDIPPVAVLLMADHGTNMNNYIPAETIPHTYNDYCITDNQYADVTGDFLPEMVFARMTASNTTELNVLVSKVLEYENTNPCMDPSYYQNPITALGWQTVRWFQICSEVVGGYLRLHDKTPVRINAIYEGNPGSVWSEAQNTSQVVNYFGPNGLGYLPATPGELGGWTGGTGQQVVNAVNSGAYILQHRDHGYTDGWGEPDFTINNILQLNNVGKMTYVFSINCQTGKFDNSYKCFGEEFHHRQSNGQNAGAVGVLCPTEVSYSFVNDCFVWGVYDLCDPEFLPDYGPYAENSGNWLPAFGNVAGKYFLAQSNWPYNTGDKEITYQMFTAHSDAFLRLYTEVPQELTVEHANVLLSGLTEFTITADEGSMIALTVGDQIIGIGTGTGAPSTVNILSQEPGTQIMVTVTKQDFLRYSQIIECIPPDGAYVIYNQSVINDMSGNANSQIEFGESIILDVAARNVGNDNTGDIVATLSTESPYVTITDNTATYASLESNEILMVEGAFTFDVAENIPNDTKILFDIVFDNGETFESSFSLNGYAPTFEIGSCSINDSEGNNNGRLDPGETATMTFLFTNEGNADSWETNCEFIINSPYVTIIGSNEIDFTSVAAGETIEATYSITVAQNSPNGIAMPYTFNVESGAYTASKDFAAKIGLIIEDFETGDLETYDWSNTSSSPWALVNQGVYEGEYCLKSGAIGNNASTSITLSYEVGSQDSIGFYYKVSSENNYDFLKFYIDNNEQGSWSGTNNSNWNFIQFPVTEGQHQFKWTYSKDGSQANGSDCAWIDFVVLPVPNVMTASAGMDVTACGANPVIVEAFAQNYNTFAWSTAGDGSFENINALTTTYTPGVEDAANGQVTLSITATDNSGMTITDDMIITFDSEAIINNTSSQPSICATSSYINDVVTVDNYTTIEWTTSGDGHFVNPNEVLSEYVLGTNDIEVGQVTLSISASNLGICEPATYEFILQILATPSIEIETAFTNCANVNFVTPVSASVSNDVVLSWSTAGDGVFSNHDELNTEYSYGTQDIENGQVVLTLTASPTNGCEPVSKEITVSILPIPSLTITNALQNICLGEECTFELNFDGTAPFTIEIEGMEPIVSEESFYLLTSTPEVTTTYTVTSISNNYGCTTLLGNEAIMTVEVLQAPATPAQPSGSSLVDSYVNPQTEYSIDQVEFATAYEWVLVPENAGTITADGTTATIVWDPDYRGDVNLSVSAINDCGTTVSPAAIVTVKSSVGLDESLSNNFKLYPNPAKNMLNVQIDGLTNSSVSMQIINILGEVVSAENFEVGTDGFIKQISLNNMVSGAYIISIVTSEATINKHFLIQK